MRTQKIERNNKIWVQQLSSPGLEREQALIELRIILLAGLKAALTRWIHTSSREFSELAEDFVQEALVQILAKIDTFKGLSRFTTWAHKICIRIALTEFKLRPFVNTHFSAV